MTWMIVGPEGMSDPTLPAEALAATPAGFGTTKGSHLPRSVVSADCQLCGTSQPLSKEHVPPKAVGNRGEITEHSFDEWLKASPKELPRQFEGGRKLQNGVWGRTLCQNCNNLVGGRYVEEYSAWAARGAQVLRDLPSAKELDERDNLTIAEVRYPKVDPGSFFRAAITSLAAITGGCLESRRTSDGP